MIKVKNRNRNWVVGLCCPGPPGYKDSFPGILEQHRRIHAGHKQIDGSVVVVIRADRIAGRSATSQPSLVGHVGKSPVAIVPPKLIPPGSWWIAGEFPWVLSADVQIQIAVMVVVNESDASTRAVALDYRSRGHVFECTVLFVMQQNQSPTRTDCQVNCTVVVIVACRAANAMCGGVESCFSRYVFKMLIAQIVVERHAAFRSVVGQENVDFAVAVVVEKARARPDIR